MSVESLSIALHHSQAKGTAKVVLLGIANHDGDGGAWPAKATLAKYANVDQRNVDRAIIALAKLREIRVEGGAGGKSNTPDYLRPNLYHFLLECPAHCDRSRQHRDTRKSARYAPRYLDIMLETDPPATAPPEGGYATPPPALAPGDPGVGAPPELNQEPTTNLPSGYDLDASARAESKDDDDRSADSPQSRPQRDQQADAREPITLRPCPQRKYSPCAYDTTTHRCIDCGNPDPAHIAAEMGVDPATGEVNDSREAS